MISSNKFVLITSEEDNNFLKTLNDAKLQTLASLFLFKSDFSLKNLLLISSVIISMPERFGLRTISNLAK